MIERTFDAEWFNGICNLPEVKPGLGIDGPIDVSPVLSNPANYGLRSLFGGFILTAYGAGVYSVHTQFAAEGRGAHAIEAMRAGLEFMFTRTDGMKIHTQCPDSNPAALALALKGGAKRWFRNELEPTLGPGQVVSWDIDDWIVRAESMEAGGEEFHAFSDEALAHLHLPEHPHDPIHNRVVGASLAMYRGGQPAKATLTYNVWASAAGYPQAQLLSRDPLRVDVGLGLILGLDAAGNMEVAECP
jgi:hypothetical protein